MVGHRLIKRPLPVAQSARILRISLLESEPEMKATAFSEWLRVAAALLLAACLAAPAWPAIKNMAVIASAGTKTSDVPIADLVKLCKGTQKAWPDGKSFTLVIRDPESPDMRVAMQKLLGASGSDARAAIAKLNEGREVVKIVGSDEDLLRTVGATPGAVGLIDVYAINSSVKVLRVDGKLPFDVGYALRGN
jgi:hypothetical protein